MSGIELIKDTLAAAGPITSAIIDTWLKPKLASLIADRKLKASVDEQELSRKFKHYLASAYERHSYINVLVLQNRRKKLDDLYIPLRVRSSFSRRVIRVNGYERTLVPEYKRVLISDTAGMGKSTIMKRLFLSAIESNAGIPVFLELRKLVGTLTVLDSVMESLSLLDDEYDRHFIVQLIRTGNFVFFLDGYDEISISDRERVTRDLQDFMGKATENHFVMTSRPEAALGSFADFERFSIEPLQRDEAFQLIRKYDETGEIAPALIERLGHLELNDIGEFLGNPLLVSLLFKSFEYKPRIPLKKHVFYRQVYDALFEAHDLAKPGAFVREKYSGLDIEEMHRVLRSLAFATAKAGQIEYIKDRLMQFIFEAQAHSEVHFSPSNLLRDLLVTVPLFVADGTSFRWSHKSLQDYFAAQFLAIDTKERQTEVLRRLTTGFAIERFSNVLDLFYDMEYQTFVRVVLYKLARDFLEYCAHSYKGTSSDVSPNEVDWRRTACFGRKFVLLWTPKAAAFLKEARSKHVKDAVSVNKGYGLPTSRQISPAITMIETVEPVTQLLDILRRKRDPLIGAELATEYRLPFTAEDQLVRILREHSDDAGLVVSDAAGSLLNTPDLFSVVTRLVMRPAAGYLDKLACAQLVRNMAHDHLYRQTSKQNSLYDDI